MRIAKRGRPDRVESIAAISGSVPAGGDASGTVGGLTVTGLGGFPIDFTGLADRDVIVWDAATSTWVLAPSVTAGAAHSLGSLTGAVSVDHANGTWQYGTMTGTPTISFTGWTAGKDESITLELAQGAGGFTPVLVGVTWIGPAPTWDTTAGTTTLVELLSRDGGTTVLAGVLGGSGSTSPLTTKGDLWGFSTVDARLPVGSDGQVPTADSTAALGISYQTRKYRSWLFSASGGALTILTASDGTPLTGYLDLE